MRNQSIAIFSHVFPPNLNVSSFRISAYCNVLTKNNWKVTVFTNSSQNKSNFLKRFVKDVSVVSKSFNNRLFDFFQYFYWSLKIVISRDFDFVLITGGPFYYFPLSIIFRLFGIKVILDFRDPWCLRPEVKNKKYKLYKYIEWLSIFSAKHVVFVNSYVKNFYTKEYSRFYRKYSVIENGYFKLTDDLLDNELLEKRLNDCLPVRDANVVVYSGKVIYRDLSKFLGVMKNRTNIILIKMGPREKVFDDLVCFFDLKDRVIDIGLLPYEDASLVTSKFADFSLLVTSDYSWEASTKVFDGLQFGIPILAIAPSVSYVDDVISYCNSGVRVNNNSDEINDGVDRILNEKFVFKNHNNYDRSKQAKRILDLVNES